MPTQMVVIVIIVIRFILVRIMIVILFIIMIFVVLSARSPHDKHPSAYTAGHEPRRVKGQESGRAETKENQALRSEPGDRTGYIYIYIYRERERNALYIYTYRMERATGQRTKNPHGNNA